MWIKKHVELLLNGTEFLPESSRLLLDVLDEEHFFKDDVSYSPRCVGVFTVFVVYGVRWS